jgi:hypothetical protein
MEKTAFVSFRGQTLLQKKFLRPPHGRAFLLFLGRIMAMERILRRKRKDRKNASVKVL